MSNSNTFEKSQDDYIDKLANNPTSSYTANDLIEQQKILLNNQTKASINNLTSMLRNRRGGLASLIIFGSKLPEFIKALDKIDKAKDLDDNTFQVLSRGMDPLPNTLKTLSTTSSGDLNTKTKVNNFIRSVKRAYAQDAFQATRYLSNINKSNNQVRTMLSQALSIQDNLEMAELLAMDGALQKEIVVTNALRKIVASEKTTFNSSLKKLGDKLSNNITKKNVAKSRFIFAFLPFILLFLLICCCVLIFLLIINAVKEDPIGSGARFIQNCGVQSPEDCLRNRGSDALIGVFN